MKRLEDDKSRILEILQEFDDYMGDIKAWDEYIDYEEFVYLIIVWFGAGYKDNAPYSNLFVKLGYMRFEKRYYGYKRYSITFKADYLTMLFDRGGVFNSEIKGDLK